MKSFPPELMRIARQRYGTVSIDDLDRCEVSKRQRTAWCNSGQLVAVARGIYRFGTQPETFKQRCMAATLAVPDGALSGLTAGRLYRLRKVWCEDVHLLAPRTVRMGFASFHKSDFMTQNHIAEIDNLRVLTPARLFCDLAWWLDENDLESVLEQMLERKMFSVRAIREMARKFRKPGRPGSIRLGRVLDRRPEYLRPAESDYELRLWRALAEVNITLQRQIDVALPSGTTVRIDLGDPISKTGVEIDHRAFHGGYLDSERDKRRDRGLATAGWHVVRVTDTDIDSRLIETVSELSQILRPAA